MKKTMQRTRQQKLDALRGHLNEIGGPLSTDPKLLSRIEAMLIRIRLAEKQGDLARKASEGLVQDKMGVERRIGFILSESPALRKMTIHLPDETLFQGDPRNMTVQKISNTQREIQYLLTQKITDKQKVELNEELRKWNNLSKSVTERVTRAKARKYLVKVNTIRELLNSGQKNLQQAINECNSNRQRLAMLRLNLDIEFEARKEADTELEVWNEFAKELEVKKKKEIEMQKLERLASIQRGFEERQTIEINSLKRNVEKKRIPLKEAIGRARSTRAFLLRESRGSKTSRRDIYMQGSAMWKEAIQELEKKGAERRTRR